MELTRIPIGESVTSGEHDYTVFIERWGNEEPDTLGIEGYACSVYFDPGSETGRKAIRDLIAHLSSGLALYDQAVEEIYAELKPGDDATGIRVADKHDVRCTAIVDGQQCWRVEHADGHHVRVSDTADGYTVAAVRHEIRSIAPSSLLSS